MDINKMTVKDFRKSEPFGEDAEFNGIILVPLNKGHESGFRMMRFVLLYDHKIVGVIDRGTEVDSTRKINCVKCLINFYQILEWFKNVEEEE